MAHKAAGVGGGVGGWSTHSRCSGLAKRDAGQDAMACGPFSLAALGSPVLCVACLALGTSSAVMRREDQGAAHMGRSAIPNSGSMAMPPAHKGTRAGEEAAGASCGARLRRGQGYLLACKRTCIPAPWPILGAHFLPFAELKRQPTSGLLQYTASKLFCGGARCNGPRPASCHSLPTRLLCRQERHPAKQHAGVAHRRDVAVLLPPRRGDEQVVQQHAKLPGEGPGRKGVCVCVCGGGVGAQKREREVGCPRTEGILVEDFGRRCTAAHRLRAPRGAASSRLALPLHRDRPLSHRRGQQEEQCGLLQVVQRAQRRRALHQAWRSSVRRVGTRLGSRQHANEARSVFLAETLPF